MLERLRRTVRELGPGNAVLYAIDRLMRAVSGGRARVHRYRLVAQPIDAAVAPLRPDTKTCIELAGPDHALRAAFPRPAGIIEQRYADGAQCLVASSGDRFAGYLWWRREHYDEDEVRCRFVLADPASSVWDFDVYVEPRYRLGRTMARLWDAAARRWHADGVRWSFSRISAFNPASLASHARLGLRPVGSAVFVVIGPCQLSLFSAPPSVHVGLGPRARPTLTLHPPG
jgi:hypothetical protein